MRAVLPSFTAFRDLQQETAQLRDRVAALERRLEQMQAGAAQE
jgi:ubiquinone biosynthesis protein UbiJ